jgi:hypothetical protein
MVQCECKGYQNWGRCKHQEGLTAIGMFQPDLLERVLVLEEAIAEAQRQIEEFRGEAEPVSIYEPPAGVAALQIYQPVAVGSTWTYATRRNKSGEPVTVVSVGRDKARVRKSNGKVVSVLIANLIPF